MIGVPSPEISHRKLIKAAYPDAKNLLKKS
nr:MAG TPA: Sphingolipid Delta4-desaturase (DES) [Caudoviricetes sp.]